MYFKCNIFKELLKLLETKYFSKVDFKGWRFLWTLSWFPFLSPFLLVFSNFLSCMWSVREDVMYSSMKNQTIFGSLYFTESSICVVTVQLSAQYVFHEWKRVTILILSLIVQSVLFGRGQIWPVFSLLWSSKQRAGSKLYIQLKLF